MLVGFDMATKVVYIVTKPDGSCFSFGNLNKLKDFLSSSLPYCHTVSVERKAFLV